MSPRDFLLTATLSQTDPPLRGWQSTRGEFAGTGPIETSFPWADRMVRSDERLSISRSLVGISFSAQRLCGMLLHVFSGVLDGQSDANGRSTPFLCETKG